MFLVVKSAVGEGDFDFLVDLERVEELAHDTAFGELWGFLVDFDEEFEGLFAMDFGDGGVFSGDSFTVNDCSEDKWRVTQFKGVIQL